MAKMVRVVIDSGEVRVSRLTKAELASENDGYASFVKAVWETVKNGQIYDDSDGDLKVLYCPASKVIVEGKELT